jgi:hypothetical protein
MPNGIYRGFFKDDRPNGVGIKVYVDGDKYEGQWLNGLFNGIGTLYLAS